MSLCNYFKKVSSSQSAKTDPNVTDLKKSALSESSNLNFHFSSLPDLQMKDTLKGYLSLNT